MKKILILCLALLGAGASEAQVAVGGKGGANFSNIIKTGDDDFSTSFKTGFHAGLFINIPLAGSLSFSPELVYSQKGYSASGSSLLGGDYDYTLTSNFIEVPVLLKINAAPGFGIHLGPQVSFLASTTESFKQGSDEYRTTVKEDIDNLRKSLVGGVIGLDINSGQRVGLSARYALDLQKNNEDGTSETPQYRNQVFQLSLSAKF